MLLAVAAASGWAAEPSGDALDYGIAAPLMSTAPTTTDRPAPVRSTTTITVASPPPIDVVQRTLSDAFVTPIAWFDSLFFTERDEVETNDSYMRFIVGPAWVNGEGTKIRRAIRVKVRVPRLKERLHLLFSDDDESDSEGVVNDRRTALERGTPFPRVRPNDTSNRSRAGVGYQILRLLDTDLDVETALRSHARGEISLRARQRFPEWRDVKTKLILTGFFLQGTGFGSIARLDAEHVVSDRTLFHFDNAVTQVHDVKGVVGDSRVSWETRVSRRTGVSPGIGFRGETRPRWRAASLYASVVLRRQFFREWLFYEFEPGEQWNRNESGAFHPQPFVALRLEAQFRRGEN